jgi:hypothetical protein
MVGVTHTFPFGPMQKVLLPDERNVRPEMCPIGEGGMECG